MSEHYPPAAFSFAVYFDGAQGKADASFREVSGIGSELETETISEGGENRFVHALPKGGKHPNLVLKRGLVDLRSELVQWCRAVLEEGFAQPIETKEVTVSLLDASGASMRAWKFENAYPVSWSVVSFQAGKTVIAVETIELAYSSMSRTP